MRLKSILLAAILPLAFGACSSAQKKADTTKQAPPASSTASQPTQTADAKSTKASHKKKAKAADTAGAALSCSQGSDQRTASIKKKDAGCEVEYFKLGQSKVVASSSEGTKHCEDVVAKIKRNLASAGFTCQ